MCIIFSFILIDENKVLFYTIVVLGILMNLTPHYGWQGSQAPANSSFPSKLIKYLGTNFAMLLVDVD